MVVVEGPDGSGKSTFALLLSKHYGLPLIHTGGPIHSKRELRERLDDLDIMKKPNVVFDRIPLVSELVYPLVQGREPFITFEESASLLEAIGPIIHYCRLDSIEEMEKNMLRGKAHKPEDFIDKVKQDYRKIVEAYDEVFEKLEKRYVQVRRYNWKDVRHNWRSS